MKGIKNILVAVDESNRSVAVAKNAIELAKTCNAKIILLHVRPKVLDMFGQPYYQKALDKSIEKAESDIAPSRNLLEQSGVAHEVLILEGEPAEMIHEAAHVEKCDIIVMGTRGLSNIQGMALGSVSNKVLHRAECMVLMIP